MGLIDFLTGESKNNKNVKLPDGKVIYMNEHTGWGDSISWNNFDTRQLRGNMKRIPKVGDYVVAPMKSGKFYKFQIIEVTQHNNPRDLFFARATDIEYVD